MNESIGESDWAAEPGERRAALVCGTAFVAAALVVTPFATRALPASYAAFGMILAATIVSMIVAAFVLLVQAKAQHSVATAVLGSGFAFAAAVLIPYSIVYPGMFDLVPRWASAGSGTYAMLWFLWHVGLLTSIIMFNSLRRFDRLDSLARKRGQTFMIGLAVAYVALTAAALFIDGLPHTVENGHWTWVYTRVLAPIMAVLALAVIATTMRRTRSTTLDVWIALIGVAVVLDVYLTVIGAGRFTLAWYASRLMVLLATLTVLGVLLSQAARMYASLYVRAQRLENEAHTDILTGLPNRRRFEEEIQRAFGSAVRRGSPLAVALADIDRFKRYNDAFGHQAGDEALHRIAQAIADSVDRSGDFAARYGGEEFLIILEDTTLEGAVGVAERIRGAVLDANIPAPGGGMLSISVGVATSDAGDLVEDLIGRADAALYDAKNAGRNRVSARSLAEPILPYKG